MRYIVEVKTPRQGRVFYAECYSPAIVGVLTEAVKTLERLDPRDVAEGSPLFFQVSVLS